MKKYLLSCVLLCSCSTMHHPHGIAAPQAFDEMKSLVGTWQGTTDMEGKGGGPITVTYDLRSNGSVLVEHLSPGSDHEMISVYHKDGDKLEMTHYCSIGNQPNLVMIREVGPTKYFEFAGATNMSSEKDMHIHRLALTQVDANTLKQEWTAFKDGEALPTSTFTLKRVQ